MNGEEKIPRDPTANALAKLLLITRLTALDGTEVSLTEQSEQAMRFIRNHMHNHTACDTCDQIYLDAYRTGYMHAGGEASRLPTQGEKDR